MDVRPTYHLSISLDLRISEQMARALAKADDWGVDVVVKGVTQHIPESEAAPVRAGLTAFFREIHKQVDPCLFVIDQQRRDIHEAERRRQEHREQERLERK